MKSTRTSLFAHSVKHLVFVAFAMLALLPTLALLRIGIVLLGARQLDAYATIQVIGLGVFCIVSCAAGLWLLVAMIAKVKQVSSATALLQAQSSQYDASRVGNALAEAVVGPSALDRMAMAKSRNELESLSSALERLQLDISQNFGKLHEQARFLESMQAVLDKTDDMVIITDEQNVVLFSNNRAKDELGILTGGNIRYALAEGKLSVNDYSRCLDILEDWQYRDEEVTFQRLDGAAIILRVKVSVLRSHDYKDTKLIMLRDATEKIRLERQLYRSEKLASLGQLISGVAHELNNPLAAILGFAELCRNAHRGQELDSDLEVIEREARRTAHIVENLLSFSRQRQANRTQVDVHELIERCFTLLAYNFRTNNIVVRRDYDATVPSVRLDEYQIQQVFMNLILNAVQAMAEIDRTDPAIAVRTYMTDDEHFVCADITDCGPGIPGENIDRVFEPFFTTKNDDQGTGLGLPVSLNIVKSHGGELCVRNTGESGSGACFTIKLPVPADIAGSDGAPTRDSRSIRRPLTGRVLAVDDELSLLKMTKKALTQMGLDVKTENSVRAGLATLASESFDLVLVDVYMPDGNGTELWQFVQKNQPKLADKVIFMSGDPRIRNVIRKNHGVDATVLLKPFHLHDLQAIVKAHLHQEVNV